MLVSRALGRLLARQPGAAQPATSAVWLQRLSRLAEHSRTMPAAPGNALILIHPSKHSNNAPRGRHDMPLQTSRITPCLWFDSQAEEAVDFYTRIFPRSRIGLISRFGEAGFEHHGRAAGSVMTVEFFLDGQPFTALNGGPMFRFTEAISLMVACQDQAEIDHYWNRLSEGGPVEAQNCGWLKDKFGLSWQIIPHNLVELMAGQDRAAMDRVMTALLQMGKPDLAVLERARLGH